MRELDKKRSDQDKYILRQMRLFYLETDNGRIALTWLLKDLGWLEPIINEESRVLHNYALHLLDLLGISDEINMVILVDIMSKQTIPNPEDKEIASKTVEQIIKTRRSLKGGK